jgi:outer membrane immunogenic protein
MKKILLGSVGFAVMLVAPAMAADMPVKALRGPPPPVLYNWTGCYVGVSGGWAGGDSTHINRSAAGLDVPITPEFDLRGGLIGGTLGCNWQTSNWLFGIEGDASWTNKKGSVFDIAPFNTAFTSQTKENWIGTIRGRVGITAGATNEWLFFATGGLAVSDIEINVAGPAFAGSESQTRWGWTAGGGIEWGFAPKWSAKVEGLFIDWQNKAYFTPPPAGLANRTGGVEVRDWIARAGINFHF